MPLSAQEQALLEPIRAGQAMANVAKG